MFDVDAFVLSALVPCEFILRHWRWCRLPISCICPCCLCVTLVLEAADAAGASALETRLPECREAALAASIEFARLRASPSSPVDAQRLANDLSIALRPVDRAIAAVLLVEVSARRA